MRRLDRLGITGRGITATTSDTGSGGVAIGRVVAVEPVHGHGMVIPDGKHEHHLLELVAHLGHSANGLEVVVVAEDGLLLGAEVVVDVVYGVDTVDLDCRMVSTRVKNENGAEKGTQGG